MKTSLRTLLWLGLLAAFHCVPVTAQSEAEAAEPGVPAVAGMRMVLSSWDMGDDEGSQQLHQLLGLNWARLALPRQGELRCLLAVARNQLDAFASRHELAGVSDVRLAYSRSTYAGRLHTTAGLALPTGKSDLDNEELLVLDYLLRDYLSIPLRRLGEGVGVTVGGGWALLATDTKLVIGAEYAYAGSYEAYAGRADYDPGDQLSCSLDLQHTFQATALAVELMLSTSTRDRYDKHDVFARGALMAAAIGLARSQDAITGRLQLAGRYYGRSRAYAESEVLAYQLRYYGNELACRGELDWQPSEHWNLGPRLAGRFIGKNEMGLGAARIVGIGGQVTTTIGESGTAELSFTHFLGTADAGGIDLRGSQLSLTLWRQLK